jgi:hypothetical protein
LAKAEDPPYAFSNTRSVRGQLLAARSMSGSLRGTRAPGESAFNIILNTAVRLVPRAR